MNKREAIQAMLNGEKITMPEWDKGAFIYMDKNGDIIDEEDGWFSLNEESFNGWEIYKPEPKFEVGEFVQSKNGYYYRIQRIETQNGKYHYELASRIKDTEPLFLFEENVKKLEEVLYD